MTDATAPAIDVTLHPIDSSYIAAIGHHEPSGTLAIQFTNGKVFHYAEVPPDVYETVRDAPSIGATFAKLVRSRYAATCIVGKCVCGDTGPVGATCTDCGTAVYA